MKRDKKKVVFGNLVNNAFDFLDKAGKEFEQEPKYSVIHFYAALELFLKARLLHEHWTLALTKPESADLNEFQKGNFHSVSLREAQKRLKSILQQGLADDEFKCFEELGNHRNRMVHFFHSGHLAQKSEIEAIVSQQCRAWFYLNRVLTQKWKAEFTDYLPKIDLYDKAMHKQRQYLVEKFNELRSSILSQEKAGVVFHECPSCGHHALKEYSDDAPTLEFQCLVCDYATNGVAVECKECHSKQTLISDPFHKCTSCGHNFSEHDVKKVLMNGQVVTKDSMYDRGFEASCGECLSYFSVISLLNNNDIWMCSNCFTRFDSSAISACEWCNDFTTEDTENSYWGGCEHCEGSVGWHKDD